MKLVVPSKRRTHQTLLGTITVLYSSRYAEKNWNKAGEVAQKLSMLAVLLEGLSLVLRRKLALKTSVGL